MHSLAVVCCMLESCLYYVLSMSMNMLVLPVYLHAQAGDTRSLIFIFAGRGLCCCGDFAAITCILFIAYL